MGQKVNPIAFRLAVSKDWRSKWYASGKDYTDKLHEDLAIRGYLKNKLQNAGLARVVIERAWNSVRVTLHTSRSTPSSSPSRSPSSSSAGSASAAP